MTPKPYLFLPLTALRWMELRGEQAPGYRLDLSTQKRNQPTQTPVASTPDATVQPSKTP